MLIEQQELHELKETTKALSERIGNLDRALIPYYAKRRQLMNEIGETHGGFYREASFVVTRLQLDRDSVAARAEVFPELDRLNALNRPAVNEVRLTRNQLRGLLQRIDKLRKVIEKDEAKAAKKKQSTLL